MYTNDLGVGIDRKYKYKGHGNIFIIVKGIDIKVYSVDKKPYFTHKPSNRQMKQMYTCYIRTYNDLEKAISKAQDFDIFLSSALQMSLEKGMNITTHTISPIY